MDKSEVNSTPTTRQAHSMRSTIEVFFFRQEFQKTWSEGRLLFSIIYIFTNGAQSWNEVKPKKSIFLRRAKEQ